MESLLKRIERNRREHDRLIALILCLSLIVSIGTFAVFHKKAVAKTYIRQVLDCPLATEGAGLVVHTHNDDCFDENHNLVCTLPELEAHTHTDACYTEVPVQVCGLPESDGHVHGSDCRTLMLTCEEEEREATFDEEGNMADPGHIHTPDCYSEVLSCGMEEGDGAHTHTDACYETEYVLACDKPEIRLHVHTDDCYQKNEDGSIYVDEDGYSWLICGLPEIIQHAHGPECFKIYELDDGEPEEADEIVAADEIAAEPAGDTDTAESIDEEKTDAEESGDEENTELTETEEAKETTDTEDIPVPAVSMPAQSWERTAGGIKVSVEAPEGAFPENTRIAVTPVNGSSLKDTVSDAVNGEVLEVQAVDITFFNEEGREIEPAVPIRVTMTPAESRHENEAARVIHIDNEQNAEVIAQAPDAETEGREIAFDADAFTIYAIAYVAVEFEYEVDGKVFTSTMPGAENMLLSEIVRGLGIVSEEETDTFISKITSVASTNTEVAAVEATGSDWTVRVLKDGNAYINVTMQDSSVFSVKAEADGVTEISDENAVATISTVNDLYLPADSAVKAEILTEEQSGNAVAAVQTAAENEGSGAATYQAFSIALENVDVTTYDGFKVAVTLPEDAVVGRDFQLYQVREDGTATDLTESLTVTSEQNEDGLQKVSGISFTTEDFADFVLSYSIETYYTTADGDRYRITLNYGPKAEIPDGAELKVREILPEDETYGNYLDDSAAKLGVNSGDVSFARFFDIEIQKDDEKIEPKAPVQVTISLADTPEETLPEGLKVVHFAETGLETIDEAQAEHKEDATIELSFEANGFSVYGVVYTVDFHYEINGKVYDFSIPGGGFISLEHIVEALGLGTDTQEYPEAEEAELAVESDAESAEATGDADASEDSHAAYDEAIRLNEIEVSEAAREFVADVVSVEFSSPELVWVGKVNDAATVGGLKEANELEIEYSADLTEAQIAEINAQTVEAGDWALISVQPFVSEETLTVTMEDGQQYVIRVTDAQIKKTVIDAKGDTWEITVTYGEDAQIPEGADLDVKEILPEDEKYEDYYRKAIAATNGIKLEEDDPTVDTIEENNYARFFDIIILNGEEKIEPKAVVKVDIKLVDTPETDDEWKVIHFDATGPVIVESETIVADKTDSVEMKFDTDGFSVYGVITVPSAQQDPFITELDGRSFTISHESRYVTTTITPIENNNNTSGFGKTSSARLAATWYFERPAGSSGNTYYIYTLNDNGEKQYINLTKNNNNTDRANASLSGNPQVFTVTRDGNTYRLATQSNGTTYYLDEHNGNSGNAFAGWYGATNNGRLNLNFSNQPVMQDNGQYMTLVKYNDKYYIVNNDCSLTEVDYNEATKTVEVDDPMMWSVSKNNPNGHIYFNSTEVGFNDIQTASDWYRRYLDPSSETGYLEETNGLGPGHVEIDTGYERTYNGITYWEHRITDRSNVENNTTISIDNTSTSDSTLYNIYHGDKNGSNYLGVIINADGTLRLAGQQSGSNAAEFVFASPTDVKNVHWTNHTVNHIDISIAGTANVSVPLAYGNYYGSTEGDKEAPILTVTDNMKVELAEQQMVDPSQLRIRADDMKRATISAARADDGTPLDDAFYVTGYSGNVANGTSNDQVRIEGSFLVADLRDTQYEKVNEDTYQNYNTWNANNYTREVRQARKNNIVEYTVTVVKPLTYNLIYPGMGQLYDADGNPITITVDVAFSASFNYWDSENECPGVRGATGFGGEAWTSGGIDPSNISGMDFKLGGDADNPNSPLVALEITKVIMDEAGNRIMLKDPVTNYFDIYENKNADNDKKNGVAGLHVVDSLNHPEWQEDSRDATIHDGYDPWRTKRVTVDESGSAIVFDYNATDAMYYIVERHDEESLPETVMDKAGNEFLYVKTYFETEYVRRDDDKGTHDEYSDKTLHPQAMHLTEDFTRESPGKYAYASIPEVAGKFTKLDGVQKKEGFLEFYVYNIYRPVHSDISVQKQWQDSDGTNTDWLADVEFKLRKKTITVSGEGNAQTQTVTYYDVIRPDYMGSDWSDIIRVTSTDDVAKWEGLPVLEENESYVVIEYNIIGGEGTTVTDISRDEASSAITSFKLTKNGKTYTYDVTNGLLGDEGGTTINKQRKETDITLKKVDRDDLNRDDPALLKGASFTITKFDGANFQGKDTTWGTSGSKTVSDDKEQNGTYTLNGVFTFEGLSAGYYQIEETRFPDGYVKISGNPRFKVEEDASQQLVITLIDNPENIRLENNKLTIVVGNTPGVALPNTGGIGTTLFTALGGLMTATAGAILTLASFRRRRETVS